MTPSDWAATSPDDTPAVRAAGLTRRFGDRTAVDSVDLEVAEGSVFGLLGPDGAGKSTLIRLLVTVLAPTAGAAEVFGRSVISDPGGVTPRIGYMSQQFCMYPDLTVAENLDYFATLRGVARADRRIRQARLLAGMGLSEFAGRQARHLSGGMKQKLMLAATLMHEPDLLLLDEPTTGVDPVSRREFWHILTDLHREGRTVLVATPYMDEAQRCTDLAFMADGRIRHRGTPQQIAGLVPGVLLEVAAPEPRAALAALLGAPSVTSAHLSGDVVRVLWSAAASEGAVPVTAAAAPAPPSSAASRDMPAAELTRRLARAGVPVTWVRVVAPDLEAAFAALAPTASRADP